MSAVDHVELFDRCPKEGGCGRDVLWIGRMRGNAGCGTEYVDIRCVCDDTVSTGFARQVELGKQRQGEQAA